MFVLLLLDVYDINMDGNAQQLRKHLIPKYISHLFLVVTFSLMTEVSFKVPAS